MKQTKETERECVQFFYFFSTSLFNTIVHRISYIYRALCVYSILVCTTKNKEYLIVGGCVVYDELYTILLVVVVTGLERP